MGKRIDLTQGKISHHVLRMLGPFTISIIAIVSAGVVDTIYLGHISIEALAMMGFCFPIIYLLNSVNIGLGAGALSAISRAIGQKEFSRAKRQAAAAIILALIILSILAVFAGLFLSGFLDFMGAKADTKPLALVYMKYALPALVIVSIPMMANNVLRAYGEAVLPSTITLSAAFFNIIIDPFLIFGIGPFPRLEVEGAAIATLIANSMAALYGLYLLNFHRRALKFVGITWRNISQTWTQVGRVGFPASLSHAVVPVAAYFATTIIGRSFGTEEVAAYTLTARTEMLAITVLYALSASIGALTGQNGGAGLTGRVRETFVFCFKVCVAWSLIIAVPMALLAGIIPRAFTDNAHVIALAKPYFWIVPITISGYGFVFVSAAGFNALGRPGYGLSFTIIRSLALYVPFIGIGVITYGMTGAFIGIALANIISGLLSYYITFHRASMEAVHH